MRGLWGEAASWLEALTDLAYNSDFFRNVGMTLAIGEATARAREAWRRAKNLGRGILQNVPASGYVSRL